MLNKLEFKTQNQECIDTSQCRPLGNVQVGFALLLNLFGLPRLGGERDDQIQWDVRFADGAVCTVYNWHTEPEAVSSWFVGATNVLCVERLRTLVTLRAEASDPDASISDLLDGIDAKFAAIAQKHGDRFVSVVRVAHLSHKMMLMVETLIDETRMPAQVRQAVRDAATEISAHIVAHVATLSDVIRSDKQMLDVIDHVHSIEAIESRSAELLVAQSKWSGSRH